MMNRFQVSVTCAYAEGAYASLANNETWRKDIDELGDGLFRYLILELSTEEECETWAEAINRVETAIHELEQASAALRATYLQEKPDGHKAVAPKLRDLNH
jgi:coenzyme F420-reducing hydrogenase delta subunit